MDTQDIIFDVEYIFPFVMIMVFLIAGLCMVLIPIKRRRNLIKRCSATVFATVIRNEKTYSSNGKRLYSPVYSFEFNKQKYEVNKEIYTNIEVKQVGDVEEIQINPDNPNEFLDNSNIYKVLIVSGGVTILFALLVLFALMIGM